MRRRGAQQLSLITLAVCLAAIVLRAGILWAERDRLHGDPDAYLGIARNIAAGVGYSMPGSTEPTAYRPPLYPTVVALQLHLGAGRLGIALYHLTVGAFTVLLTAQLGRRLGLGRYADLAAMFVAIDPILVQYAARNMTETTFAFLVTLLLFGATMAATAVDRRGEQERDAFQLSGLRPYCFTLRERIALGIVFGLAALCRPSIWAFGVLGAATWVSVAVHSGQSGRQLLRTAVPVVLAVVVTIFPWAARNFAVFGRPIVTTTHGGYTLLLGNNPVFYSEVVSEPWGTVWRGESLEHWQQSLRNEMADDQISVTDEIARDEWMYRRALQNIAEEPGLFLQACWLRLRRLWNVVPSGPASIALPDAAWWAIGVFYGILTLAMLAAVVRLSGAEWRSWLPLLLLLVSFSLVHLFYWSNMRMRAPLVPAVALLGVRGIFPRRAHVQRPCSA